MKENLFIKALKMLNEVDLLGSVGVFLIKYEEDYPITVEEGNYWVECQGDFENAYNQMATSQLVGSQDSLTQIDWIAEEEVEKFENEFYDF